MTTLSYVVFQIISTLFILLFVQEYISLCGFIAHNNPFSNHGCYKSGHFMWFTATIKFMLVVAIISHISLFALLANNNYI